MDAQTTPMLAFDNAYALLPGRFYASLPPKPVLAPRLIKVNEGLARELDIDPARLASDEGVAVLAGNVVPMGAKPLALAYAGHQFGNFVPQLGDGRAVLLGEVIDAHGRRRDIQLKGSGPTPFSRRGDGRAALGPVLREYIVSEAMAALGIPTTRSLAAMATGETVWRETPLPGAVLTRVAASHIRIGTFQYFAVREDVEALRILTDYVIARHYPEAVSAPNKARAMLDGIVARQAQLIAKWLLVGFIHGVMNTDNMAVSGETLDYGPCAFMDTYNPRQVYSSIDEMGRYAYGNQPAIAQWNLARLAETLLPLLADTEELALAEAQAALDAFAPQFNDAYQSGLRAKLGLQEQREGDHELAQDLLKRMAEGLADFTLTFRKLADLLEGGEGPRDLFVNPLEFDDWAARWKQRVVEEGRDPLARVKSLRAVNPMFIPRNHRIEYALAAAEAGDFSQFETMVSVLATPFDDQPEHALYATSPEPDQIVQRTFCGT